MSRCLATSRSTAGVGIVRARGQFATRAPSTASVNERERVSDVMSASSGRAIGASERAALLGTDANTQDRATDDGDEEAWERSLVEAPRRSFGARAAVVTVATLACGAFAAIASTHATGGEVSLFASALGSTRGERVERLEARERLSHGNKRERRQAKQMKRQAGRASEDSSERLRKKPRTTGRQTRAPRMMTATPTRRNRRMIARIKKIVAGLG